MKRQSLIELIKNDMQPALGVTEPGAIAFAVAKAKSYLAGTVTAVTVTMNSGMYKNAFTCGIPNSPYVGNVFAAALGVVAGNAEKGLEALAEVTPEDNEKAKQLVTEGKISIKVSGISSRIFIEAQVQASADSCTVTIVDKHTNIVRIVKNGEALYEQSSPSAQKMQSVCDIAEIHKYSMQEIYDFITTVPIEDIAFIQAAYDVNMTLFQEGLKSTQTTFVHSLYKINGNTIVSKDERATAQLLCNGAIEARVIGLDKPAMSITGSGAHGIICTMPLLAACRVAKLSEEQLLRATALSYLVTMYIKEYSGRLSAFCGCAIAGGTGMACALAYLKKGGMKAIKNTINNMAASITGMICDGGNQGCTMKGIVAVDTAFRSVDFALQGICIDDVHSIIGKTVEQTFRNMGRIASPGMTETEKVIIDIFEEKQN
jgi:L-cysteine desulfidase